MNLHLHCIFPGANPCPQDGFYYITRDMFAECANQLPFERQCPAGTQNPNLGTFIVGLAYSHNIFCSLNDNDQVINSYNAEIMFINHIDQRFVSI